MLSVTTCGKASVWTRGDIRAGTLGAYQRFVVVAEQREPLERRGRAHPGDADRTLKKARAAKMEAFR